MSRTTDAKQKTIAAAMRLFRRQGYHGTGLHEILDTGGAPRGSLYFHFPGGKEEIGVRALTAAGDAVAARIAAAAEQASGLAEFLKTVLDGMAMSLERSAFEEGCPVATVALDTAAQSGVLAQAAASAFRSWEAALEKALVRFGLTESRASRAAPLILAQLEGALLLARTYRSLEPIARAQHALNMIAAAVQSDRS